MHIIWYKIVTGKHHNKDLPQNTSLQGLRGSRSKYIATRTSWVSLKAAEVGVKCRDQLILALLYGDDMVMLVMEMRL